MTPGSRSSHSGTSGTSGQDQTVFVDVPTELGPYRLTRILGRGGMGEVWQAFDTNLERDVAVKLMRRELLANEEAVRRFGREARAVARLNHTNIVQVYAFGDEKGVLYFVMELVEGETLSDLIKRQGVVELEGAVLILLQAIEGLSYASVRGIVHRDIKPSNLMLTPDGRIKIADFGLAKMVEQDSQMTAAGSTMGSPNYMSPEQARGEEADHRSDIYSLGITLYQMLTGQLPFTAQTPLSVLLMQIQNPLPEPPVLKELADGRVLTIIKRMTEKRAGDRYQTYADLAADVATLAPGVRITQSAYARTMSMPTPDQLSSPGEASPAAAGASLVTAVGSATDPHSHATASSPAATGSSPGAASSQAGMVPTRTLVVTPPPSAQTPSRKPLWPLAAAATGILALCGAGVIYLLSPPASRTAREGNAALSAQETAVPPAMSQTAAEPAPVASPSVSAAAAAPPAPTSPPPSSPTPAPAVVYVPVAVLTPAPPPVIPAATPAPPPRSAPAPSPTPLLFDVRFARLGPNKSPDALVQLYDSQGAPSFTLPARTRVELVQGATLNGRSVYLVSYQGQNGYVPATDAELLYTKQGAHTAPGEETTRKALPQRVVLGQPGGTGRIDIYEDELGRRILATMSQGSELEVIEEGSLSYKVRVPGNSRPGYVLKKLASPAGGTK